MYICQKLSQQTDRRYRRDWRVVTFRLVRKFDAKLGDHFVWEMHSTGKWWCTRHGLNPNRLRYVVEKARDRAAKYLEKDIPVFQGVFHGNKLTRPQAVKLTGIPQPGIAMDYLREDARSHEIEEIIENFRPSVAAKIAASTPEAKLNAKVSKFSGKHAKAQGKVQEIERKIKRWQTLLKKWKRREKLYARKMGQPVK